MQLNTDIPVILKCLTGELESENWHSTYYALAMSKKHCANLHNNHYTLLKAVYPYF